MSRPRRRNASLRLGHFGPRLLALMDACLDAADDEPGGAAAAYVLIVVSATTQDWTLEIA